MKKDYKIAVAGTGYVGLVDCHIALSAPSGDCCGYYPGEGGS